MRIVLIVVAAAFLAAPVFGAEPESPGRFAVLIQTTSSVAALQETAERVYPGVSVVEPLAVSSVMTDDDKGMLTDGVGERLRARLRADRLLLLEQHMTPAGSRILRLRVFDKTGAVHRKTVEVTDETVRERVRQTLDGLPSWRPKEASVSDWIGFARSDDNAFFDVNFFGGRKMLAESEWGPLATQNEIGGFATVGPTSWPVHLALEAYGSRASHDDTSATIVEVGAGARRIFDMGPIRPYVGAGIDFVRADYIVVDAFDDHHVKKDRGTGYWAGGGAAFRMGKFGNVGVQFRYSSAEVGIGSRSISAGGVHAGVTVGFGSQNPTRK